MWRSERGVALLEVLAAVTILGLVGLALLGLAAEGARAVAEAERRERELADQERLLAAHTLLARSDLDRRLGVREIGPYVVEVQRPEPELYRIAVRRAAAVAVEDLVTVVHRPRGTDAP